MVRWSEIANILAIHVPCGLFISYVLNRIMCTKPPKGGSDNDEEWESDDSEESEEGLNKTVRSTKFDSSKDKVLFQKFPLQDDLKMMLAVRTDLGM